MKPDYRQILSMCLLVLGCSIVTACARPYYLVTSDFMVADNQEAPPEIVESQTYRSRIPTLKSLAVMAPEGCANETAAQSSGEAEGQRVLLKTTCGIEMAELERALAKGGFQVISWNALQKKVIKENVTPQAASKELGAEVLFQINSLERSLVQTGQDARWERRFYQSNHKGEQLDPASLPVKEGDQLVNHIKKKEASLNHPERLSMTINASASLVETGETIWFYEWTHAEAHEREDAIKVLATCHSGECEETAITPKHPPDEARMISGSNEAISEQKNAKDHQTVVYHKLLRDVVTNLASSFKHQP